MIANAIRVRDRKGYHEYCGGQGEFAGASQVYISFQNDLVDPQNDTERPANIRRDADLTSRRPRGGAVFLICRIDRGPSIMALPRALYSGDAVVEAGGSLE
jgi:hypothetical protein